MVSESHYRSSRQFSMVLIRRPLLSVERVRVLACESSNQPNQSYQYNQSCNPNPEGFHASMLRWLEASILNQGGGPGREMDSVLIRLNPS